VKIAIEQEPADRKAGPTPQDCLFTVYSCDAHMWGCHFHQNIALASVRLVASRGFQFLKCISTTLGSLQAVIYNKVSYRSSLCCMLLCELTTVLCKVFVSNNAR